jgi:hypothetical protein
MASGSSLCLTSSTGTTNLKFTNNQDLECLSMWQDVDIFWKLGPDGTLTKARAGSLFGSISFLIRFQSQARFFGGCIRTSKPVSFRVPAEFRNAERRQERNPENLSSPMPLQGISSMLSSFNFISLPQFCARSSHRGLVFSMRSIFFFRRYDLICFSRLIHARPFITSSGSGPSLCHSERCRSICDG